MVILASTYYYINSLLIRKNTMDGMQFMSLAVIIIHLLRVNPLFTSSRAHLFISRLTL